MNRQNFALVVHQRQVYSRSVLIRIYMCTSSKVSIQINFHWYQCRKMTSCVTQSKRCPKTECRFPQQRQINTCIQKYITLFKSSNGSCTVHLKNTISITYNVPSVVRATSEVITLIFDCLPLQTLWSINTKLSKNNFICKFYMSAKFYCNQLRNGAPTYWWNITPMCIFSVCILYRFI